MGLRLAGWLGLRSGWLGLRSGWLGLRPGWLGLRPGWRGLRPGWMAQRGGRTYVRTYERTDERKISPFYRTSSPIGAAALLYFLLGFHGGRQGSGPNRGRSPVEWGDFPFVRLFVHPSVRPFPP